MNSNTCPHCGKELDVGHIPSLHMERYGNPILVKTECCGKPVSCTPYLAYSVRPYFGPRGEDDWGSEFDS